MKEKESNGGSDRVRTDDPLLARQMLSQLSYTPNEPPVTSSGAASIIAADFHRKRRLTASTSIPLMVAGVRFERTILGV